MYGFPASRSQLHRTIDLVVGGDLVFPPRLIRGIQSHDILLGVEEVHHVAIILTWNFALRTVNLMSACRAIDIQLISYLHIRRPTRFLNNFESVIQVVGANRHSNSEFLPIYIAGMR